MTDEQTRTWAEVVSTDFVYSVKRRAWFEVIEIWTTGTRVHFRLRDATSTSDVPASATVSVRRSPMGAAADVLISVLSSGPSGQRDAGVDQLEPFHSRVRNVKRVADAKAEAEDRPRTQWATAKATVLDDLHAEALAL